MFITFEGPDGSGKSTQIVQLAERVRAAGRAVLVTREPGGTEIGEQIRTVLHNLHNTAMTPRAEVLLFSAARAQLVDQAIRPHLAQGGVVISDRFFDSTLAYQGYGHGLDLDALRALTAFATGGLRPDRTLLLDLNPQVGLQRRQRNAAEWNRLDAFDLAFHQRVRDGYQALAALEPERWRCFEADQAPETLADQIWSAVAPLIDAGH
jgi:dTMP kinase